VEKEKEDRPKIEKHRLFAFIITGVGFVMFCLAIVIYLQQGAQILVFVILAVLGIAFVILGLYILVKTKPPAPKKAEEYDEEIPDSKVDFDDWASQKSVETYKSERPDPTQYKPKKEYKAFPAIKKEEKKSSDD